MENNLEILSDPRFWLIQLVIGLVAWITKRIFDYLQWRAVKRLWFTVDRMEGDAEEFRRMCERELSEAPSGFLKMMVARGLRRRALEQMSLHRVIGVEPVVAEADVPVREVEPASSKRETRKLFQTLFKRKNATTPDDANVPPEHHEEKRQRTPRVPITVRVTGWFNGLGAGVIGGEEGDDFKEQWVAEQGEINNRLVRAAHALTNIPGSIKIRFILKTLPWLRAMLGRPTQFLTTKVAPWFRDRFSWPIHLINCALDAIARSDALTGLLPGGGVVVAIMGPSYLALGSIALYVMAAPSTFAAYRYATGWQRRRLLRMANRDNPEADETRKE
ncbi:hypothetical protein [Nonomuraea fuscirosea]|uniref:hypothetical protein n=1 Tax=Nonomuraea fuscirosea TaxID=1291556 RepID=UPI0033FAD01B